jgi:Leucine-rich repeat (LRR) protein
MKITRKEFEDLLTSKESYFIGSIFNKMNIEEFLKVLDKNESNIKESKEFYDLRSAIKHSNSLEFKTINKKADNSWLYFNQNGIKRFYKHNDFVIFHNEEVNFIVYLIK